jgi:hypothetical protein
VTHCLAGPSRSHENGAAAEASFTARIWVVIDLRPV